MSEKIWAVDGRPTAGPGATPLGRWEPATSADLTAHRLQLAAALQGASRPAAAEEGAVERLLLAFEELASNALRHGRQPVRVAVTAADGLWLLDVSDAGVDQPPTPAVGRDAAYGGMGLYLVASICTAHGWFADRGRKHAWGASTTPASKHGTARRGRSPAPPTDAPDNAARADQVVGHSPGSGLSPYR